MTNVLDTASKGKNNMNNPGIDHIVSAGQNETNRLILLFSIIFFFSGISALLYQVAWQRILTTYYGVGAVSVTTIVTVYMLGLGLGGLAGGALSKRTSALTKNYCLIELLISICGFSSILVLSGIGEATKSASPIVALGGMFAFLFFPTLLMGMTLPILTAIMTRMRLEFMTAVSGLYCYNTLGASLGAFVGAYVIITLWGIDTAVYLGATINLVLALTIGLTVKNKYQTVQVPSEETSYGDNIGWLAYALVFLTGFIAIGYEIVWFRSVEILVKASPYAFATVLSIYLTGIALGSGLMHKFANKIQSKNRALWFYSIQVAIAAYGILAYTAIYELSGNILKPFIATSFDTTLHPDFTKSIFELSGIHSWFAYFDFLIWPAIFMLIPTTLMGASFPLISSLARKSAGDEGTIVGNVYFFNILGNVLGGLVTGFVLIGLFGTATTTLILAMLATPFVYFAIRCTNRLKFKILTTLLIAVTVSVAIWLFPSSENFIKALHIQPDPSCQTYVEEGAGCVSVVYQLGDSTWHYINGLAHGGRLDYIHGFYQRAIEGLSYAKRSREVLVIGYGTGAITEAILKSPEVEKVTVVELSKPVMDNLKKVELFRSLLEDKRIELVIEDGRRYLNRTDKKFDAIFMDPLRSTTAYSNNIYSKEFLKLAGSHLNKGGIMMIWLDNRTILPRTIASVFNHVELFYSFCIAGQEPLIANQTRKELLLNEYTKSGQEKIKNSDHKIGNEADIWIKTKGISTNTDLKPRCEYYLGYQLKDKMKSTEKTR